LRLLGVLAGIQPSHPAETVAEQTRPLREVCTKEQRRQQSNPSLGDDTARSWTASLHQSPSPAKILHPALAEDGLYEDAPISAWLPSRSWAGLGPWQQPVSSWLSNLRSKL